MGNSLLLKLPGDTPLERMFVVVAKLASKEPIKFSEMGPLRNTVMDDWPELTATDRIIFENYARANHVGMESIYRILVEETSCSKHMKQAHALVRGLSADFIGNSKALYPCYHRMDDAEQIDLAQYADLWGVDSGKMDAALRAGEPSNELAFYSWQDLQEMDLPDYEELPLLGRLGSNAFFRGAAHLVIAGPKVGKTRLLFQSAQAWGSVRYFTEDSTRVVSRYMQSYKKNNIPLNPEFQAVSFGGQGLAKVIRAVEGFTDRQIVIVDTLRIWAGVEDENGVEFVRKFKPLLVACRAGGHTLIVLHHAKKAGGTDPVNASSGNNSLPGLFDQVISLEKKGA